MKLENAKSRGWPNYRYRTIQERSLFVGVHIESENQGENDCVVLLFNDKGKWEIDTNRSEDAFYFLHRLVDRHSRRKYGQPGDPLYKEFIIITFDACLTLPIRPEYGRRDVELENKRINKRNGQSQYASCIKIRDWLTHLPLSGTAKRIFLETDVESNFPIQIDKDQEKNFAVLALEKLMELEGKPLNMKGWDNSHLDYDYYRHAFLSMLVSMAYGRWKSNDKSGVDDYLKLIADRDGTQWLLDYEAIMED